MQNRLFRKSLVIGIMILFVGAGIIPSISGNIEKINNLPSAEEISLNTFDSDLVAWWSFDEGSGSTVHDHSGNGNDGTIYGASWTTGIHGYALDFDGANDYVEVPDSSSLGITQEITLSTWAKFDVLEETEEPVIVFKRGDGGGGDEVYKLGTDEDNGWKADFRINSDPLLGGILSTGVWYHIAGTFDGSSKKIYINGIKVAEGTQVTTIQTSSKNLYIGVDSDPWGFNQHMDGIIDEVRIYDMALTESQIQYIYNNPGNQPPNKPSKPSGQTHGKPRVEYIYTTSTTDPEGIQVYYKWDWDDGSFSDWLGPYDSGLVAPASHNWSKGSYNIRVKAKDDSHSAESDWSEPLTVTMPRNRATYNSLFLWFLEHLCLVRQRYF